jgi:hypothetical protein
MSNAHHISLQLARFPPRIPCLSSSCFVHSNGGITSHVISFTGDRRLSPQSLARGCWSGMKRGQKGESLVRSLLNHSCHFFPWLDCGCEENKKEKLFLWTPWRYTRKWKIAPLILNLVTRYRWVVSCTYLPLNSYKNIPLYPLNGSQGKAQIHSEAFGAEIICSPAKNRITGPQTSNK